MNPTIGLEEILIINGANGARKRKGFGAIIKNGTNDADIKAEMLNSSSWEQPKHCIPDMLILWRHIKMHATR
jgi:hypothetical protein